MSPAIPVFLAAFTVSAVAVGWLARSPAARLALDQPNDRSLHTIAVPRTGGIGLLTGAAAGWVLGGASLPPLLWCGLAVVIAVSLLDDLRGLSAAVRFAAHLLAAALAAVTIPGIEGPVMVLAAILTIGWMCNLYNFMDGSDGLAGGMAVFGFLAYAVAAWLAGSTGFALMNVAISAAAAGFLLHNFHPARIFMGDAGSVPLGFLAASLGFIGWQQQDWTWWFPLLVFSPFIVDASVTLARRLLSGARIWEAHRDHYYQRLVQLGLGHRGTALAEYGLMLACAAGGLWTMTLPASAHATVLGAFAAGYLGLVVLIGHRWKISRCRDA